VDTKFVNPWVEKLCLVKFCYVFFLFYDLFYDPWLSYLLEWKENDKEKERTNKLTVKKLH
jgi:hypothetical protein